MDVSEFVMEESVRGDRGERESEWTRMDPPNGRHKHDVMEENERR
jgi:hypothetical protein